MVDGVAAGLPHHRVLVPEPWGTILRATFVPHIEFSVAFFFVITAVIGTTITPYMFFWQASQEVEDTRRVEDHFQICARSMASMYFSRTAPGPSFIVAGPTVCTPPTSPRSTLRRSTHRHWSRCVERSPHSRTVGQGLFALSMVSSNVAVPILAGLSSYA